MAWQTAMYMEHTGGHMSSPEPGEQAALVFVAKGTFLSHSFEIS